MPKAIFLLNSSQKKPYRDYFAQFDLGVRYLRGIKGATKNQKIAFGWILKSAQQGYDEAELLMGFFYAEGNIVPQDYVQAFSWYLKAAERGNAIAMYNIGLMFYQGEGLIQSDEAAYDWFYQSAQYGYEPALEKIQLLMTQTTRR